MEKKKINLKKEIFKYLIIIIIFILVLVLRNNLYDYINLLNYNDSFNKQNVELEILESENKQLEEKLKETYELNNIEYIKKYNYLLTEVQVRNIYNFFDIITIDYGKDKDLKEGMPVIAENGLVGLISEVDSNSSKVELITKPSTEISVIVHGAYGILSGYSKEDNSLIIEHITNYDTIEEGDLVYTSGLGNLPHGILIGKVKKITYDNFKIEKNIYVESKVDFNNLNYLGVIK